MNQEIQTPTLNNAVLIRTEGNDKIYQLAEGVFRRDFSDQDYTAVATINEHYAEVRLYEIIWWTPDKGPEGVPSWQLADTHAHPVASDNGLDDAEVVAELGVKWDGCANWELTQKNVMMHICNVQQLRDFGEVLARAYEWVGPLIPAWDGE